MMKRTGLMLAVIAAVFVVLDAGAQLPVRSWNDDMPQHTFSLGIGPSWFSDNPVLGLESRLEGASPVGFDVTLRYDWSYFRGYEVSLGAGLTYMFTHSSYPVKSSASISRDIRIRETLHYAGVNAIDTKMWFGRRVIWDVCIHVGYLGGNSLLKQDNGRRKVREHGVGAGVSTGIDCLITAWLGVGIHFNVMAGALYPTASSLSSREYTRGNLRVGAVYCF